MDTPITKTTPFNGNRLHTVPKHTIVRPHGSESYRHPTTLQKFVRPPLAHLMVVSEKCDSFSLRSGRHHLFPRRSFNATLSNIASANNRFSWRSHPKDF
jgi:hypothetical protein